MNKRTILAGLFVIDVFCIIASACPCSPCPPCYSFSGYPNCQCSWDCGWGACCDDHCCNAWNCEGCDGNGHCIPTCHSINCETCKGDGHGNCIVCDNDPNQRCCDGTCYDLDANEACCDSKTIYNSDTEKCCGYGTGKTCDKDETCCEGNCCNPEDSKDPNVSCCCAGEVEELLCSMSEGCGCDPLNVSCSDKTETQPAGAGPVYFAYGTGSGCRVYLGEVPCNMWRNCTEAGCHYMEFCICADPDVPECYCTSFTWPYCQDCIGYGEWETEMAPSERCIK